MRIVAVLALLGAGLSTASSQSAPQLALSSPATAGALGRIEDYLLTESALGRRLTALLPLITAREMNLAYEWGVREDTALKFGLEPEVIDVVRRNGPVTTLSGDDALIVDFGRQLFRNRHVDARTFAALVERLGRQGAFDAIMLLAYPAMTGVLQRAVDQQPPSGFNPERLPAVAGVGTPTGRPGEFAELGGRPPLPGDVYDDSYYRFPLLTRQELDPRGREIFDRVVGADRATTPRGPVGMTFLSPELVEPVQEISCPIAGLPQVGHGTFRDGRGSPARKAPSSVSSSGASRISIDACTRRETVTSPFTHHVLSPERAVAQSRSPAPRSARLRHRLSHRRRS